jgi:DNA-binding NtrC family response regulator
LQKSNHSILVTIPDTALLDLIGEVLEHIGHHPVLCKDEASTLIALAEDHMFPVAVFDWELSKRVFPDLFKQTLELFPKMRRLVLIDQKDRSVQDCIKRGDFCSYVKKPFELKIFEKALSECISKYNEVLKEN